MRTLQSALAGIPSITKAEYEPSSRGAESRLCSVVCTTALYELPSDWEMETRPWVTNGARSTSASCGGKLTVSVSGSEHASCRSFYHAGGGEIDLALLQGDGDLARLVRAVHAVGGGVEA